MSGIKGQISRRMGMDWWKKFLREKRRFEFRVGRGEEGMMGEESSESWARFSWSEWLSTS